MVVHDSYIQGRSASRRYDGLGGWESTFQGDEFGVPHVYRHVDLYSLYEFPYKQIQCKAMKLSTFCEPHNMP